MPEFSRLQVRYVGRLGVQVGIFVAVDHLRRAGRLTPEQQEVYFTVEDHFQRELPDPPFYADGNSIGAVTWFRTTSAGEFLGRLDPLRELLRTHGVEHDLVRSDDPGTVAYSDPWQVGVVPYQRLEPTPAPVGLVLGPTHAGSKRVFAREPPPG